MATVYGEDNFSLEMGRVRKKIKQKFEELIDCVKARECQLLKELDAIVGSYQDEKEERKFEKKVNLNQSPINRMHDDVKQSEIKPNLVRSSSGPRMVHFVFDSNIMLAELSKLGKFVEKVRSKLSSVDYKRKVHPVVSVCEKGNRMEQLYNPYGVTIDSTIGNIYVADQYNHCVKVFDDSGNILFKFGDSDGGGKMLNPRGLVISADRILVSNDDSIVKSDHNILVYKLNGDFVYKIGKYGKGNAEFNLPRGLACNESNGDIYICDYGNNRIQILSKKLQFKSQFGADQLKYPRDVKLSQECIYILDGLNSCIHLYDYHFNLRKSVVSRGNKNLIANRSCFYIHQRTDEIFISDSVSDSIHIFNPQFELIHKINTSKFPMGVVVDNLGRIIVVCRAETDCLQIF